MLRSVVLLAALTLTGCSQHWPCTGEVVPLNASCALGCTGFRVWRYPTTPCGTDSAEMILCAPEGNADVITCIIDEDTGAAYALRTGFASRYAQLRRCTAEEHRALHTCSNP